MTLLELTHAQCAYLALLAVDAQTTEYDGDLTAEEDAHISDAYHHMRMVMYDHMKADELKQISELVRCLRIVRFVAFRTCSPVRTVAV